MTNMKKTTRRVRLTKQLGRVQAEAERVLNRGYEATLDLLPDGPREAVEELASQLETQRTALRKRGQRVLKVVEQRRKAVVSGIEKQGKVLLSGVEQAVRTASRRSERALSTVEARRARLIGILERRTAQVVERLAHGLDLATLGDVERLSRRLAQIERRRSNGTRRAAA